MTSNNYFILLMILCARIQEGLSWVVHLRFISDPHGVIWGWRISSNMAPAVMWLRICYSLASLSSVN